MRLAAVQGKEYGLDPILAELLLILTIEKEVLLSALRVSSSAQ
jgi:hypothetical protein